MGHVSKAEVVNCTQKEPVLSQQLPLEANSLVENGEAGQQPSSKLNVFDVSAPVSNEHTKWRQQQLSILLRSTRKH